MTKDEKFLYWLDTANQHYAVLDTLQKNEHYLLLLFSCQQAIEMLCKGLFELYNDDTPPFTHNILGVLDGFSTKLNVEIPEKYVTLFEMLIKFYISGRYPDYKRKLTAGLTKEYVADTLEKTKEAYQWLLTLRP
jgi:HEPN domain-containing protein